MSGNGLPASSTVTVVIPTISRPCLLQAIQSSLEAEQIVVVGDGEQPYAKRLAAEFWCDYYEYEVVPKCYGHPQLNFVLDNNLARGDLLQFIGDDDEMAPGGIALIRKVAAENPGKCLAFLCKRVDSHKDTLGIKHSFCEGHITGQQLVVPNIPEKLGRFGPRYAGDWDWMRDTVAKFGGDIVWTDEVTVLYGTGK